MRVALRLHGGLPAAACVEQARAAERAGFSTVWFAENPFNRGVLPAMAACALATATIRIGIGVFNPFNRHPTLIAMEMGALDELSGGRAVLGIGAGIKIAQMGLPAHRPIAAVRDAVQIIRPLLRGEEVDYAGKIFKAEKVRLEFPLRRASMPILMAAVGDQALRLAGELADGLMISNMSPPAYTRRAVGDIDDPWSYPQVRHRIQLQDMVDAIREDRDPVLTGEDARVSLAINMAIYESSRTGREVFLKDLAPSLADDHARP